MPEIDLAELAHWIRAWAVTGSHNDVRPADLQRQYRLTFTDACRALETLQARGVIERIPGTPLAWKPASATRRPDGRRLSIVLSDKEHAALLRLLDAYLADWQRPDDSEQDLRSLRSKLLRKDHP